MMRVEYELLLRDAPGTLAPVLEQVGEHGGNILSVVHRHEESADGHVPVVLVVDVEDTAAMSLTGALTRGHRITRIDQDGGAARAALLLTGHVFQANLESLLEPIFEAGGRLDRVDARIAGRDRPSAVWIEMSADDATTLAASVAAVSRSAVAAGLIRIPAVEGSHA